MTKYIAFTIVKIKEGLSFRVNLFTSIFGGIFRLLLLIYVWKAIYIGQNKLAGYSEDEMLFYMVIASAMGVGGMLSVSTLLGNKNNSGDIVVDLIKPVSLPWCYFFYTLGDFSLRFFLKTVPTLLIGFTLIPYVPYVDFEKIICFILLFLGGCFLNYWLNLCFASFTFRTMSSYGINILWASGTAFLTGLVVPIPFFPENLKNIINWTPFPSVAYTPIKILIGETSTSGGLAQLFETVFNLSPILAILFEQISWILIVLPISFWIYNWNVKFIKIQGG